MNVSPQDLNTAILIMQKASLTGDQAYAYVQTVERFKAAIRAAQQPAVEGDATDGGDSETADEQGAESAEA